MKPEELPDLVQRFFTDYLISQRNLSAHTQSGYRDTFRLLLPFLSLYSQCSVDQLGLPRKSGQWLKQRFCPFLSI